MNLDNLEKIDQYRYFFAALLTVIIFVSGIAASNVMDELRQDSLETADREDLIELESLQLQMKYLEEETESCSTMEKGLTNIVEDYNENLGRVQGFKDSSILKKDEYSQLKREYVLSGLRYWMTAEDLQDRCNQSYTTALFFTSNVGDENCDECQRVGNTLTDLKQAYGDDFLVFSAPTEMDEGMIELLKNRYNVSERPAVVVNGEKVLKEDITRRKIETELTG